MKNLLRIMVVISLIINAGFGQLSEKMNFFITGGLSLPVESFTGAPFTFPYLDNVTETDFAANLLRIKNSSDNFSEYWKPGFNIGGGLQYQINSILSIEGGFSYNSFVFDQKSMENDFVRTFTDPHIFDMPFNRDGLDLEKGTTSLYTTSLSVKVSRYLGLLTPYITAGGGLMIIDQDVVQINYYDAPFSDSENTITFYDEIPGKSDTAVMGLAGAGIVLNLTKKATPFIEANYQLGYTDNESTIIYPIRFGIIFNLN